MLSDGGRGSLIIDILMLHIGCEDRYEDPTWLGPFCPSHVHAYAHAHAYAQKVHAHAHAEGACPCLCPCPC